MNTSVIVFTFKAGLISGIDFCTWHFSPDIPGNFLESSYTTTSYNSGKESMLPLDGKTILTYD